MKYIKRAYQLVSQRPIILLLYSPIFLMSIANVWLSDYSKAVNNLGYMLLSIYVPLFIIMALSLVIQPLISKVSLSSIDNPKSDTHISIRETLKYSIPRYLLCMLVIWIAMMVISIGFTIAVLPGSIALGVLISSMKASSIIMIIPLALDILGKVIIFFMLSLGLSAYANVYLTLMHLGMSISDLIKQSFLYTFNNYKKLVGLMMLIVTVPLLLLLSSNYIYNSIVGIPMLSNVFIESWMYLALYALVQLIMILFIPAYVLVWSDEQNKEKYLSPKK